MEKDSNILTNESEKVKLSLARMISNVAMECRKVNEAILATADMSSKDKLAAFESHDKQVTTRLTRFMIGAGVVIILLAFLYWFYHQVA